MYALAINGSPRPNGNTRQLLEEAIKPLTKDGWDTEVYQLGGQKVRGCVSCYSCVQNQNRHCIIDDDCINEIIEKMLTANAIIIGSPTYFADVSSEVKALLDRSGFVGSANGKLFRGKIGAAVIAVRRGGGVNAFETINRMFYINQFVIPGSLYWNIGIGRNAGEVQQDAEGMANMKNLGETISLLGKAIEPYVRYWPM